MAISVTTSLSQTAVKSGEEFQITVTVSNSGGSAVNVTDVSMRSSPLPPVAEEYATGLGTAYPGPSVNNGPQVPAAVGGVPGTVKISWNQVLATSEATPRHLAIATSVATSDGANTASSNTPSVYLVPQLTGASQFAQTYPYPTRRPVKGELSFISNHQSGLFVAALCP